MSYSLVVKEEALLDIVEITAWYEKKRKKLGAEFVAELDTVLKQLKKSPFQYQVQKKEIRQASLHKFPYLVIYEIEEKIIVVYSVLHTSRNPKLKYKK